MARTTIRSEDITSGEVTPASISDQANTSTGYLQIPSGTTAQRPGSPAEGHIRFNTTTSEVEQYSTGLTWSGLAQTPFITSISPTNLEAASDPQTVVITGKNFSSGLSSVTITNSLGATTSPTTVTRNSATQVTITWTGGSTLTGTNDPFDIKVTNPSGQTAELLNMLTVNSAPAWTTAAGSLGTVFEDFPISPTISVVASEPDGNAVTYALASGNSLPTGVSMTTAGVISGTPNVSDTYNSSGVTHNFSIEATDSIANAVPRAFSVIRKWYDGASESTAAPSAKVIRDLGITTEGSYWIKPAGESTAYQLWCILNTAVTCGNDGGGWVKVASIRSDEYFYASGSHASNWDNQAGYAQSNDRTSGTGYSLPWNFIKNLIISTNGGDRMLAADSVNAAAGTWYRTAVIQDSDLDDMVTFATAGTGTNRNLTSEVYGVRGDAINNLSGGTMNDAGVIWGKWDLRHVMGTGAHTNSKGCKANNVGSQVGVNGLLWAR